MAVVLVVDDEFGIAEILQAVLEDEGHLVQTAINGSVALERMAQQRPDLVITDYMMPVMDGLALMKRMAATPHLESIPIILMSSLPAESVQSADGQSVAFIRKPFRIHEVVALVASILR